jgi:haloacetate dehalogenase
MEKFTSAVIATDDTKIFVRSGGSGEPLMLLHGFPETHVMWREIAPSLARKFTVVCADLRGYGRSGSPKSAPDHAPYSKRALAREMVAVMESLGFRRFGVVGHDRGGRVAYRMAIDQPDRIERVAALDVLPIESVWERADAKLALGFWPWSLLAQSEPLPERVLTACADTIVDHALKEWGSPLSSAFPPEVREAYRETLGDPEHAHAICEEYRAAAAIDREHDRADRKMGRRIRCPFLALWSAGGPLDTWYESEGGPLALWREWASDVRGQPVLGGHFFPEENPTQTVQALLQFFGSSL